MVAAALYADTSNSKMLSGESSPTAATIASKALVDVTLSTSKPMQISPSIDLSPNSSLIATNSTNVETKVAGARVVRLQNDFLQEILPNEKDNSDLFAGCSSSIIASSNDTINVDTSVGGPTATTVIGSTTSSVI